MNHRLHTLFVAAMLASGLAHAGPVSLLTNGNFESGLSGWSVTSTNAIGGGCDTAWNVGASGAAAGCTGYAPYNSFVGPQSGTRAAYAALDGNGPQTVRLAQTFSYVGGTVVNATLNWWDAVGLGAGWSQPQPRSLSVDVTIDGHLNNVFTEAYANAGAGLFQNWQQTTLDLTSLFAASGAGTHTVTLGFNDNVPQSFTGPGVIALDNVQLLLTNQVPEPQSLALAGLGLLCAGLVRRRKTTQAS
ncbi:PEP-CTERM putative exosortase interaction domain-containing protein [Burkholderiales bacterium JOSHI_001]|nr:PEP-CTERM putative exosortase interaction domain-containing protein [Burkholderiales bacterium JOSHI_001]